MSVQVTELKLDLEPHQSAQWRVGRGDMYLYSGPWAQGLASSLLGLACVCDMSVVHEGQHIITGM